MCTTNNQKLAIELLAAALAIVAEGNVRIETNKELPRVPNSFLPKWRLNAPTKPCACKPVTPAPKPFVAPQQRFEQEPDGVQIVVDRPRIENYGGNRQRWAMDMAKYRELIDQAKKCDHIKTRKPDWIPDEVHNNRCDWYERNEPMHPRQIVERMAPNPNRCNCIGWNW